MKRIFITEEQARLLNEGRQSSLNIPDEYWKKIYKEYQLQESTTKMKLVDFASKDKYKINGENLSDYCHVIDEMINSLGETGVEEEISLTKNDISHLNTYNDVDLSSFKPKQKLNKKIWVGDSLNSKVRMKLLDIADDFIDTLDVDWVKYEDIILTGSLANYNWSKYSDFDLHIIYDFKKIDKRTEFVKNYFDAKKEAWNNQHEDLKLYGFPVEVYVQDKNEKHTASGIYSVDKNEWKVKPNKNKIEAIKLNKYYIKEKVFNFMKKIDKLQRNLEHEKDMYKIEVIGEKAKKLWDKIRGIRKDSLKSGNEMSSGNIIFKCLRRFDYMGILYDIKTKTYDKINSLK